MPLREKDRKMHRRQRRRSKLKKLKTKLAETKELKREPWRRRFVNSNHGGGHRWKQDNPFELFPATKKRQGPAGCYGSDEIHDNLLRDLH